MVEEAGNCIEAKPNMRCTNVELCIKILVRSAPASNLSSMHPQDTVLKAHLSDCELQ